MTRLAPWGITLFLALGHWPSERPLIPREIPFQQANVDAFWAESDLEPSTLTPYLEDSNCRESETKFLACINAVQSAADRWGWRLEKEGQWQAQARELPRSERQLLQDWKQEYSQKVADRISFPKIWKQVADKARSEGQELAVVAAAINAYFSVIEDPHTYIIPLGFYEKVLSRSDNNQMGFGFVARKTHEGFVVRKVFPDSPAARAGLRKGDRIVAVNEEPLYQLAAWNSQSVVRGEGAGEMTLQVERREGEKLVKVRLAMNPEILKVSSVEARFLPSKVGQLTIHKFSKGSCDLAKQKLEQMLGESMSALVLDLRDNPGGQVDEAACLINLFVEKGRTLFTTKYLDAGVTGDVYLSSEDPIFDGPLTVLINGGSASASEIVAGSLQDLGRATLVGQRSFGKGSFQDGMVWMGHEKVALFQTRGFYYFPSGWTPQLVGLKPDVEAAEDNVEIWREGDLYYSALNPGVQETGLEDIEYRMRISETPDCGGEGSPWKESEDEDPSLKVATEWLRCASPPSFGATDAIQNR